MWLGKLFCELRDHQQAIYSVLFSPDGKFLLTGGQDGYIKVWDYRKGNLDYTFSAHNKGCLGSFLVLMVTI
ncbi:MAG: WD40 repeat domain-containing protein [Pseudanabaenaceae cyanobacterium]